MIKIALLSSTLYLTPIVTPKGENGTFGLKYTQKISSDLYFKIRTFATPSKNEITTTVRLYLEKDF
jgi:hypothetical protein